MTNPNDTIFALSSGALPAGVAIVRLSGPQAEDILMALSGKRPQPRVAGLAVLRARDGEVLDRALTLFFPHRSSFTGEPVVELHLHGGRAVVRAVLEEIGRHPGARPAEAGEFTRRAFINGKIDLTAAEGIADLVSAETDAQRRFALRNSGGEQEKLYSAWRQQLIEARAMIEADLDFSDEGDVPGSVADDVATSVSDLRRMIAGHIAQAKRGEIIREGYRVVIAGEPNVGKSSLLNALARREVAIVSDQQGTTRDLIDIALDLNGYKVVLTDTAGLRTTDNAVEQIGIERARKAAGLADLVLHLYEAGGVIPDPIGDAPRVLVASKIDLATKCENALGISTVSGAGISELLDVIAERAASSVGAFTSSLPSQHRHVHQLVQTVDALDRALVSTLPLEFKAEELRIAADRLGRITGAIGVEDLLDVVFSRFCIGK